MQTEASSSTLVFQFWKITIFSWLGTWWDQLQCPELFTSPLSASPLQEFSTSGWRHFCTLYTSASAFLALWADRFSSPSAQARPLEVRRGWGFCKTAFQITLENHVFRDESQGSLDKWRSWILFPTNPRAIIPLTSCTAKIPCLFYFFY